MGTATVLPRFRLGRDTRRFARHKDNLAGYLFLAPWLFGFFALTLGPMIASFYLSFTHYDLLTPPRDAGIYNYERLLTRDTRFESALTVTFNYVVFSVPLQLLFALGIAMLLNRGIRGLPMYRAVFYLPSLLGGSVAIAIIWREIFGIEGLINQFILQINPEYDTKSWIGSPDTALWTLILLRVWQFGSPMIIFLAGLKQVPQELYEAAEIDGAGSFGKFRKITLPLITPILFFNLVMQMISAFQSFTPAYIVSGGSGGPADSTLFYSLYIYNMGFRFFRMGYASAMAWILVAIIGGFTAAQFIISRLWVYYGDES